MLSLSKTLPVLSVLLLCSSVMAADGTYVAPRNMWGQPDLQGVWNFSSNVPFQRPEQFGQREFMTDDEIAAMRARLAEADAASDQAVPSADPNSPGGIQRFLGRKRWHYRPYPELLILFIPRTAAYPTGWRDLQVQLEGSGRMCRVSGRCATRSEVLPRTDRKIAACQSAALSDLTTDHRSCPAFITIMSRFSRTAITQSFLLR